MRDAPLASGLDPASAGKPVLDALPLLGLGEVRHRRLRPTGHAFSYRTYFLMLPMRSLALQSQTQSQTQPQTRPQTALRRNRFGALSFYDRDHGEGGPDALAWLDALLDSEGVRDAEGEVWLHTYPRVLGYVFKPVSFWYCHRIDGSLAAVVVEVNNTFGERHCYFLSGPELGFGREQQARKVFHVSPFCQVRGHYRFRFMRTAQRTVARVDHHDAEGALLQTSVSGHLQPLTPGAARAVLVRMPLMTLAVMARIHFQAVRLWLKGVPFVRKPEPPVTFTTR